MAEQVVDEAGDQLGQRVADQLDRAQDEADEPESAADQSELRREGATDAAALDLHHRRRPGRTRRRRALPGTTKADQADATRAP